VIRWVLIRGTEVKKKIQLQNVYFYLELLVRFTALKLGKLSFISGVGKSSLVYACARQFNFTVMEVHAGENRNGTALRKGSRFQTQALGSWTAEPPVRIGMVRFVPRIPW